MSARTELVARLPWVTRLEQTTDCDGYRYAHMPFKAFRDPEIMAKYKCKVRARWQFRALKRGATPARDGTYCWSHLWALGLYHGLDEEARTRRGLDKLKRNDLTAFASSGVLE
jgi:hypothetical protein